MKRRTSAMVALVAGPVIGALYPFLQVWFDCRAPESEACVWGKALLPLSIAVSTVIVGAIAAALVFAILEWRRRKGEGDSTLDD